VPRRDRRRLQVGAIATATAALRPTLLRSNAAVPATLLGRARRTAALAAGEIRSLALRGFLPALLLDAAVLACAVPRAHPQPVRVCPRGFDASFVQLRREQLGFDHRRWRQELSVLRSVGVKLIIIQFSGDERGAYDGRGVEPVGALLDAAADLDMSAFLGLHHDAAWPSDDAAARLPPPLDDPIAARALAHLCARSPACAGWYLPQEIDDGFWSSPERTAALRMHIARAAQALRAVAPGRPIAIAPFFTRALDARAHASWWSSLLEAGTVDIVMLQDGVGTGRATPAQAGSYLAELRPVLARLGVELWAVAELFRQVHGPPVDQAPFAAVPIDPATLRRSLAVERPLVERVVAFAVLDYMDPRLGGDARRLAEDHVSACRVACRPGEKQPCR
jgi:Domain of unknown function (DUF4434)